MHKSVIVGLLLLIGCAQVELGSVLDQAAVAISCDDSDKLALLLQEGLDAHSRMPDGSTLLETAIAHKSEKSAKLLIEKWPPYILDPRRLDEAFDQGLNDLVKFMVDQRAYVPFDFNTKVLRSGNINLFNWLLERMSLPALYLREAADSEQIDVVEVLLEKRVDHTRLDLIAVFNKGNVELVRKVIKAGFPIKGLDVRAASQGETEFLDFLHSNPQN